ncbi:NACHT, LRR and PYD domains-containing protein 4C-like isoform X1 [Triticum dicoccoides]|uniref:NACHT, LRR and PYD domains-containing protein 4C-like isoform X1 n=1 Tax=Triticum dicoccoides TaxID=85692 RepID=UPI00188F32D2|nr:NACHT, LRR and PYD domains-containing protein 4C-like isoform X1 [Triticum dicoccoides]XP_037475680.1 NACHT, LRR and PYD domains-containing protein 4C-like isoform X1 [Triticum dicoccoides]XP_037475681.1 NACHT, LRR and PYD domains-containing protein 4C-like isoform X1 [Triticum dicoccoides]XP_037475682.1 NACHT, LRR and PYD domains-containing protein 4C-like isoform X1 [Triticum dicoccoides]XP_037475683.1 NACHT, LRR and PYD domains-containing protein 4C-like isoform X1 [Triticum dicoccoides]
MAAVRAKAAPPTLLSLCLQAVAAHLTADAAGAGRSGGCSAHFDGFVQEHEEEGGGGHLAPEQVAEALPWELLHQLASSLPPFALELLHHGAHARCCSSTSLTDRFGKADGNRRGTKRSRCEDFNTAWQALFESRWPLHDNTGHDDLVTVDWQQQYWEKHLQECLDEAAEAALLPSFRGSIGELSMSDKIMSSVYLSENISQQYSRLSYQWTILGSYARCLRFQNVLCTAEVCDMLQHSRLEILVFVRIISEHEVNGVCLLLSCHAKTLLSLEFIHCQLYPAVMDKVCTSLCQPGSQNYKIQSISIKSSPISESKSLTTSAGLLNFLSYAKCLQLLSFNDAKMQPSFAKMIIRTLLEFSSGLQTLDMSENNFAGWFSTVDRSSTSLSSALKSNTSLNSLTVLNLKGNNLQEGDMEDVCKILAKMSSLISLDISDNPITDEGIRYLIPFLELALQRGNPLRRLRAENCDLSSFGVTKLLDCLASINKPLDMLSIADNHLGSSVAATLVKFLGSHVRELNVEDIGLGPIGFQILEEALPRKVKLSHINISKNRGGIGTAHFISRLILQAPNLVSVDAGSNLLPPESLEVICNALKQTTCNLTRLDLMGNLQLSSDIFPAVFEFKKRGKPILLVPLQQGSCAPYDADP